MVLDHMFKIRRAILMFILIQLFLVSLLAIEGKEKDSPEFSQAIAAIEAKYAQYHRIELGEFVMGDGNQDFQSSPYRDRHLIYYDAKNLYYCVVAEIDSSFTKGKESMRDYDSASDEFCLRLITQPDAFLIYVYSFTPLENKVDYTLNYNYNSNYLWTSNYQYSSRFSDKLWVVEATIPFNDLRYSGGPPYTFSVMLSRYHQKSNTSYWYPHIKRKTLGLNYFKSYYPIVIEHGIQHEWMPQLRVHSTAIYDVKQERGNRLLDNMGLNFSLKPGKSSTAKFTLHPDFSDTPLDSESNIYNTKYPPMIAENRFFFTEDYDQLVSRSEFWYTRQIISPLAAVKYNYKQDKSAVAFLALKDKKFEDQPRSGDYWLASGFARSVGNQQGFLNAYLRASENGKNVNALASLNLGFRPWSSLVINPEFALSHDHNEANTSDKTATMGALKAMWQSENVNVTTGIEYREKDFTARMGYLTEDDTDIIGGSFNIAYSKNAQKWYNSLSAQIVTNAVNKLSTNEFIMGSISFFADANLFKNSLSAGFQTHYYEQVYDGIRHPYFVQGCNASYQKHHVFRPGLSLDWGQTIVYSKNEVANFFSATPSFSSEINQNTTLGAQISYYLYDTPQTADFDNEFFFGDLNLKTQFVDKLSITQGIRLNNYTIALDDTAQPALLANGYLGYYANLNWKVTKHLDVIAGYKSRETRYRMGNYRQIDVADENLYIKAEYQF